MVRAILRKRARAWSWRTVNMLQSELQDERLGTTGESVPLYRVFILDKFLGSHRYPKFKGHDPPPLDIWNVINLIVSCRGKRDDSLPLLMTDIINVGTRYDVAKSVRAYRMPLIPSFHRWNVVIANRTPCIGTEFWLTPD